MDGQRLSEGGLKILLKGFKWDASIKVAEIGYFSSFKKYS